jgi:hypothetical protein
MFHFEIIIIFFVTILIGLITYLTSNIYFQRKKFHHIPGPESNGILGFYFGNLKSILVETRLKKRLINDVILDW